MMDPLTIWVGAVVTLVVFSYAMKDNVAYRYVQSATLGTYMGMFVVIQWNQILYSRWWLPIADGFAAIRNPAEAAPGEWQGIFWLAALVPGSLWYFQLSKKFFWVSTIISGFFVGVAAGLAFKREILLVVPQIAATIQPINPFALSDAVTWQALFAGSAEAWAAVGTCVNNLLLIILLFGALFYFFFSVRADHVVAQGAIRFGRVAIMVCLGALFGNTVMTRVAYLIERLLFLYNDWLQRTVLGGLLA